MNNPLVDYKMRPPGWFMHCYGRIEFYEFIVYKIIGPSRVRCPWACVGRT